MTSWHLGLHVEPGPFLGGLPGFAFFSLSVVYLIPILPSLEVDCFVNR